MRVACIGNTNNNLFSLTRYLRDRGIDAHLLLLDNETEHFHPSADTFDLDFQTYTRQVSWGSAYALPSIAPTRLRSDLEPYDFLIGCSTAPAAVHRAGRRLDIFAPFGGDMYAWPFFRLVHPRHQLAYCRFSRDQRTGIRAARYFNCGPTNEDTEAVLARLRFRGERLLGGLPMVYTPVYHPDRIPAYYGQSCWYAEFQRLRQASDLVVFHHARHVWRRAPDRFSWKGNDRLIRGFARFVRERRDLRAALWTFEYGSDVAASRALVEDLGIADHVHWFPRMERKDIMVGLGLADVATGEFHHSWLICGTIYEALAMGKPLLHYREDQQYEGTYSELYPVTSVREPGEIAAALHDHAARPEHFRQRGREGLAWHQRYAVDRVIDDYVDVIGAAPRSPSCDQ